MNYEISRIKPKEIALIGLLSATITGGKLALSFIPNVEIVTLLFILYANIFGIKRTLLVSFIFTTMEIFIYGMNTWLFAYYLVWPLLVVLAWLLGRGAKNEYSFALLAGLFGLLFGLLFAITESFFYGWAYGVNYWIRGIPFDIVHGFSNFILALILYKPLYGILSRQKERFSNW